jgi:hypothetical protein
MCPRNNFCASKRTLKWQKNAQRSINSILQSVNRSRVNFRESMRDIWLKIAIAVPSQRRRLSGDLTSKTSAIAESWFQQVNQKRAKVLTEALQNDENYVNRVWYTLPRRIPADAQRYSSSYCRPSNVRHPLNSTPSSFVSFFRICCRRVHCCRPETTCAQPEIGSSKYRVPRRSWISIKIMHLGWNV